jgi:hypothetical protein
MTFKKIFFILLISSLSLSFQVSAQGDLLISPTRVMFDGKKQRETLNLVNTGKDIATYSISFVQYKMNDDGSFIIVEKPDSAQMFADPYLRIFPRRVTLAPGEPQVVMVQCRRTPDMMDGEYRSHLYFRSEKNVDPLGIEKSPKDTSLVSVQLIPIYGMSIPIIIRVGEVNASASLSNLKLESEKNLDYYLRLTINRTGNISTYGDIIIDYIPNQGRSYEIGVVKGVGVYSNLSKRNIIVKLNNTTGKSLTNGKLKVQYISNDETKRVVYAEEELKI